MIFQRMKVARWNVFEIVHTRAFVSKVKNPCRWFVAIATIHFCLLYRGQRAALLVLGLELDRLHRCLWIIVGKESYIAADIQG